MQTHREPHTRRTAGLRLEALEAREVPALTIQINYSYDTSGFFTNNPAARTIMQDVATQMGDALSANLAAISPSGSNTWSETFFDPATGAQTTVTDPTVGADTITVYVGARALGAAEGGSGGPGGYSLSGTQAWINTVQTRDWSGYSTWGGSITFDTTQNWYFGLTTAGLTTGLTDFYTAATHELGHVLGIGTSSQWTNLLSGNTFVGANAEAVYGGPVPISPDRAHWATGVTVGGQIPVMDPILQTGVRETWTTLDAAALDDLGWNTGHTLATASPPPPALTPVPVSSQQPVVLAGSTNGTVGEYVSSGGVLTANGVTFTPFPGYLGEIRVAAGDFTGDGDTDYAFTTGAGVASVIEIVDGRTGAILVPPTALFGEYTGGLYLAAGDIDGDGRDQLVVAAGENAPPLVLVYQVSGGGLQLQTSFMAFNDPSFTGGIRVAVGDLNGDEYADVVVSTASQVGAIATYSGAALAQGVATQLFPLFFPVPGSTVGLNVAVGNLEGNGYDDLAISFTNGGPGVVAVWSGAVLAQNPNTPANQLPFAALFLALPGDSGARLAMSDVDGSGLDDLVVVSADPTNGLARVFTFSQAQAGGGGAPDSYPLGTPYTVNGVYAALHTDSTNQPSASSDRLPTTATPTDSPTSDDKTYTVTVAPPVSHCTCAACQALARLASSGAAPPLVPSAGATT